MERQEIETILFRHMPKVTEWGLFYCRSTNYIAHQESGDYAIIVFEDVIFPTNTRTASTQELVLMNLRDGFFEAIDPQSRQHKKVDAVVNIGNLFEIHEFLASGFEMVIKITGKVDGLRREYKYLY